jgi:spore maturation protein CgeB
MHPSQPPTQSQWLDKNLLALSRVQPELCDRLHWPVEGDHLVMDEEEHWTLFYRGAEFPAVLSATEIKRACKDIDPTTTATIFLFGVGLGEILEAVLELAPKAQIIAWERDPWMLRQALALRDWCPALKTDRLRFALNADLVPLIQNEVQGPSIFHPLLARIYTNELELLKSGCSEPRALVCCGTLFVDSLTQSLRAQGFSILSFDVERISHEEAEVVFNTWKPDLVASINGIEGLQEFCEERGVHSICWEIDPALNVPRALRIPTPHGHIFTYRQAGIPVFEAAGYASVTYLPLAADPAKRKPQTLSIPQAERYAAPVTFVGASLMENLDRFQRDFLACLQEWQRTPEPQALDAMRRVIEMQRADFSRYNIPMYLDLLCPGFRTHNTSQGKTDPALYLAEISAAEKRLNTMAALAPHAPEVWGDSGWRQIESHGVRYRGAALHETELPLIYSGSTINVDVGRLYQDDIVTMRIFDILACGGFVIAEHSSALAELFEVGVEVASYRTLTELKEKVAYFLARPGEARAIAERGRQAVLTRHTIDQRVQVMLAMVLRASSAQAA